MSFWNPWHGCHKISAGCENCYVYRIDKSHNKNDSFIVRKNSTFSLPLQKGRDGKYKLKSCYGPVFTCMTSDFFVDDADLWRRDAWKMIRERSDLDFFIITKRIHRFNVSLPDDWGDGYDNVTVMCTVENQDRADFRLPILESLPIKHKMIACEPLLCKINLERYLNNIECVAVGGESGEAARICDYDWVLSLREQCLSKNVPFTFRQTGANFRKDGRLYRIERKFQFSQARKASINTQREVGR